MPLQLTVTEGILPKGQEGVAFARLSEAMLKWHGPRDDECRDGRATRERRLAGRWLAAALHAVAVNAAGRLLALDLGKQPHRKNHEKPEEGDDILQAVMAERMLEIRRKGRDQ